MSSGGLDPIVCDACSARFATGQIPESSYATLIDHHRLIDFREELRMLERVADLDRRRPGLVERIEPDIIRIMASDDPAILAALRSGTPFDQITPPPEPEPLPPEVVVDDAEVVEYLRHHSFALGPRLDFVREKVDEFSATPAPMVCPACGRGRLGIDPENWVDPSEIWD